MLALFLAAVWFSITIDDGPTTELCAQLATVRATLKLAGWNGVDEFYSANCLPEQTAPEKTTIAGLGLKTAPESDGGVAYGRWMYEQGGWDDADDDGCDTREEVLAAEARTLADDDEACVPDGTWWSWYDEREIARASGMDVDHMVPLAEVHESGGWRWSNERRFAYANDLTLAQTLTAVSASSNRSKGRRDPAEWKPPAESAWCQYAQDWIAVKVFWGLSADADEVAALRTMLAECDEAPRIVLPTPTPTPTITPTPSGTPAATPTVTPTRAATPGPTATGTPRATPSPAATVTASPSPSPRPVARPTPRPTPRLTPTATPVPTPTATPTAVPTPTPTPTATPTAIPTPTLTATPTARYASCQEAIDAGEERVQGDSGSGRGFPVELFSHPRPRDGDGDGVVCER